MKQSLVDMIASLKSSIIVTGAAGFIGSVLHAQLVYRPVPPESCNDHP